MKVSELYITKDHIFKQSERKSNIFKNNNLEYNRFIQKNENSDKSLVKRMFNNIYFTRKSCPIYAIDKDGNYKRFNSQADAARAIEIGSPMYKYCTFGKMLHGN